MTRYSTVAIIKRQTTAALHQLVAEDAREEERLQIAIIDLLEALALPGVAWWHTPNGGRRNPCEAAKLKRMGVRPGVPDLIISQPGGVTRYLEVKSRRGRKSGEQTAFLTAVERNGNETAVVRSLEQAMQVLAAWGAIRKSRVAA